MKNRNPNSHGGSRFFPNALALVIQTVLGTVLTLAQVKILSTFLPADIFGLFASLRGFSLLLALLAANGLPHLLIRFLPVHESTGESARAMRLSIACLLSSVGLLVALGFLVYGLRPRLLEFANAGAVTGGFWMWFWLATAAVVLKQVVYGGLQGLRRITMQVPVELCSLAVVLAWVFFSREVLSVTSLFMILGIVNMASLGVALLVFFWFVARIGRSTVLDDNGDQPRHGAGYRDYLLGAIGISLVAVAFTDVDRYLVAHVLPLELVALFHIASRITRTTNRLLAASNTAIQPEVTRMHTAGKVSDVETTAMLFLKINLSLGVLLAFAIAGFAGDLIRLVSSDNYTPAIPLLIILAACIPLSAATAPLTTVMKATDHVRDAFRTDLIWAAAYVTLILALGPTLGLVGIGLASLVACLAQLAYAIRRSTLAITGRFATGLILKMFLAMVLVMLPLGVALAVGSHRGSEGAFLIVRVVLFVAGAIFYVRIHRALRLFSDREREQIVTFLKARRMNALAGLL